MLVLGRRRGESVVLRDAITLREIGRVMFVDHHSGVARLGFTASRDVQIDREEIDEKAHPELYRERK